MNRGNRGGGAAPSPARRDDCRLAFAPLLAGTLGGGRAHPRASLRSAPPCLIRLVIAPPDGRGRRAVSLVVSEGRPPADGGGRPGAGSGRRAVGWVGVPATRWSPAARSSESRRRRMWPERGAQRGATGKAGTDDPPPTGRREVANERSEEREERGRAVTAVLRGVLERGIGVDRTPIFVNADEMEMPMPSCLKGLHTRHHSHVDMGPDTNRDHGPTT